jgi:RND family efflux transporter MFP subunit
VLASIALTCLVLVGVPACHRSSAQPGAAPGQRQPQKVSVVSPQTRELPRFVRATGTLFGDEETTIAAKVAGRIVEVARDMGDSAAPGDVLARVDPTDYQLARDEREQGFRQILASIGLEALPEGTFAVDALPTVERARLQAENAQARYERGKVLAERTPPLISVQDFADLKTAWEVAESNLRVERLDAEAKLAEARTFLAQVRVAEQRVTDSVHRAPVEAARDSTSGSPRAYEIAERFVSVGDFVQIGDPLFRLVDANPLKFRASIPERRLGTIKIGQPVTVRVESKSDAFTGAVSRVSPAVDVQTRNFNIEALVPNADRALRPGSFGVAEILVGAEQALVVPENTIVTFAGVHKVVAVVDGKAQEKPVELGQRHDGMVEIVRGLKESEVIVVRPPGSLVTGTPVAVVPGPPSDTRPAGGAPVTATPGGVGGSGGSGGSGGGARNRAP